MVSLANLGKATRKMLRSYDTRKERMKSFQLELKQNHSILLLW